MKKTLHILWRTFFTEIGFLGLVRIAIILVIPALAGAIPRGFGKEHFDWHLFFICFATIWACGLVSYFLNGNPLANKILRPGAGHLYREARKGKTAAIIQKVSVSAKLSPASERLAAFWKVIPDILDVVVLHVRDHRGCGESTRTKMFANLLIVDGEDVVVAARDSQLCNVMFRREPHPRYAMRNMLCGRAYDLRKPLSIGDLFVEYPETPRTKQYRSILTIPLVWADDNVYGFLSIDSSIPYLFSSFQPGRVEHELENSLMPYCQLLTMALELLVSYNRSKVVRGLVAAPQAAGGNQL